MITKIFEPSGNINLYTDYNFIYNSDLNNLINFKYRIEYQEYLTKNTTIFDGYNPLGAYFGTGSTGNFISSSVFTGITTQSGDTIVVGNVTAATQYNGTYYINSGSTNNSVIYLSGQTFTGTTTQNPYFKITGLRSNWETIDTFERFPEPDTNVTFDLRKYIASKIESDYFNTYTASSNSFSYDNPLDRQFRLKVSEEYAYQYPFGIFTSTGIQTGTGVSAINPKYYNLYDLKLTYTYPTKQSVPAFGVGSVVEIIDNGPTNNQHSINGIYTVLEVGQDYVIVNGSYDSTIDYYSGSIIWSDRRQIINTLSAYTSSPFNALKSCNDISKIFYTSLSRTGYNLRTNSKLMIPLIDYSAATVEINGLTTLSIINSAITSNLLVYTIPTTANTITLSASGSGVTDVIICNINDKCEDKIKKVTIYFLDRTGAFIPFYFDLHNNKQLEVTNVNWKGLNSYGRSIKYQVDTQLTEKYQITTDWLNEAENVLFEELFTSSHMWMDFENNGIFEKVLIVDKQLAKKKISKDKLVNYTITIEIAKQRFINQ